MEISNPTSCLIMIGNELLSGRTQDKNLVWLSGALNEIGINKRRAYVIPDIEEEIIRTVNEARAAHDYVFTTGGIGPTHDDITTAAIAKAFGVPVLRHPEAEQRLIEHYPPEKLNEARLKMADIPEGAELIDNPVSAAPGFRLDNVFVLAGVPSIMQAMFDHLKHLLKGGVVTQSRHLSVWAPEGDIAAKLNAIQLAHPEAEIGCYPLIRAGKIGATIVARAVDDTALERVMAACQALVRAEGYELVE